MHRQLRSFLAAAALCALLTPAAIAAPAIPKHGSTITGTVTRASDGTPIQGAQIVVFLPPLQIAGFATTAANGTYTATVVEGSFFVAAAQDSVVTEVYDNVPCAAFPCSTDGATPVEVVHGTPSAGIDFALSPKARIEGTVLGGATPTPRANVGVQALFADGTFAGGGTTAADGTYSMFVSPGTVRVLTSNGEQLIDEAHPDIPCALGRCDLADATQFTVTSGQVVTGVNFTLEPGAALAGTVTRASDGAPLEVGANVELFDAAGTALTTLTVEPDGTWALTTGLSNGGYRLVARPGAPLFPPEIWDDVPCTSGNPDPCDVLTGNLIQLSGPGVVGDFDFVLARSSATIGGTITALDGGATLDAVQVEVTNVATTQVEVTQTTIDGTWSVPGLVPGDYTVRVTPTPPLANELYPAVQCKFGFFFCVGTPETIVLAAGEDRGNIDFALAPIATLEVDVRNADTAQLMGAELKFALPGFVERTPATALPGSAAVIEVLGGGVVRFAANASACGPASNEGCLGERFPDDPCPHLVCDLGAGGSIPVPKGATVTAEVQLAVGATITGSLTASAGGAPINGLVEILDTGRVPIAGGFADSSGIYVVSGLGIGPYYARTSSPSPFLDELYDGVPCPGGACALGSGVALETVVGTTLADIDFSLTIGRTIGGKVTRESGLALSNASVLAFAADGVQVASTTTDNSGDYVTPGLAAGTYFLRYAKPAFLTRLYDGVACPDTACDPLLGTPVVLSNDQSLSGIDVVLSESGEPGAQEVIYLNRCEGGCNLRPGPERSANNTSSIISGNRTLAAYAFGDASFAALATCVREVFARYNVQVTTVDPGNVPHREHMVGGLPSDIGIAGNVVGVSPYACGQGISNSISFTFANAAGDDIAELCWTATQEIGHQFGLDHEVNPPDSMSYIDFDTKGFTQGPFDCGEFGSRACACGGTTQDSDAHLTGIVGIQPRVFANSFEETPTTSNAAGWKAYRTESPWLKPLSLHACGTDPVSAVREAREAGTVER